jgi:septal ring-binding cell division protein DamX
MHRLATCTVFALAAAASFVSSSGAQGATSTRQSVPATDSVYQRARRLVSEGDGAAGRALVDSMLRAAAEGTPAYGDALFWRGALAETAGAAERDYRRVIVEYPISRYADDALLSLAELEQARGDRTAAFQHLQRFVREHPMGPDRARAGLAAARLAFEQRDVTRGCSMIADARLSVGSADVELRNQIDYHGARCPTPTAATGTAPAPAAATPSVRSSGSPTIASSPPRSAPASEPTTGAAPSSATLGVPPRRTDTVTTRMPTAAARNAPTDNSPGPKEPATKESAPRGTWTIQLAAYNTRPDAEALVRKLAARGVKARISGEAKPFRVRLDYYDTRQDAAARVAELKQRGIIGFVTEERRSAGVSRP